MIHVRLLFLHPEARESDAVTVVNALIPLDDCVPMLPTLKGYVGKIGRPSSDVHYTLEPSFDKSSPIVFQHLGVISKSQIGELILSQFSHRSAYESSKIPGKQVEANVYGAYTSSKNVHAAFMFDFVTKADEFLKKKS